MKHHSSLQKFTVLILLFIIPLLIIGKWLQIPSKKYTSLSTESAFSQEELEERSFVFLIYTKDDPKNIDQCLSSILKQKYDNYRLLLIQTENFTPYITSIKQLVAKENKSYLLNIYETKEKEPSLALIREALDTCEDHEIIIEMSSFDWLLHEKVLIKLQEAYQSQEVWLTFSEYLEYPSYRKGTLQPYLKKMLRNQDSIKLPWLSSYFKTYRVSLFKKIYEDHPQLAEKNEIPDFLNELAKESKNHIFFIHDVLYMHHT